LGFPATQHSTVGSYLDFNLTNGPSMLINPTTGQHDTTGIAAGVTGNYSVKFPAFTVMNSLCS